MPKVNPANILVPWVEADYQTQNKTRPMNIYRFKNPENSNVVFFSLSKSTKCSSTVSRFESGNQLLPIGPGCWLGKLLALWAGVSKKCEILEIAPVEADVEPLARDHCEINPPDYREKNV